MDSERTHGGVDRDGVHRTSGAAVCGPVDTTAAGRRRRVIGGVVTAVLVAGLFLLPDAYWTPFCGGYGYYLDPFCWSLD
jgi:hypothetical protein